MFLWNNHRIRSQKKQRPNLPTGKPSVLYFTPPNGTTDYGSIPDINTLHMLQAEVADWGNSPIPLASTCILFVNSSRSTFASKRSCITSKFKLQVSRVSLLVLSLSGWSHSLSTPPRIGSAVATR